MRLMMLMIPKGYASAVPRHDTLTLDGLHPPSMGTRVSFAGGKPKIADGPFGEASEVIGVTG